MPLSRVLLNASFLAEFVFIVFLLSYSRKDVAHGFYDDLDQLEEERLVKSRRASITHRTTQDASQNMPRPSFDGMTPSAIANDSARM